MNRATITLVTGIFLASCKLDAQDIKVLFFGTNTLSGKIILEDLIEPVTEKPIKGAMVLKLPNRVEFKTPDSTEDDVITDEIRIYGDLRHYVNPVEKYKKLINQNVTVKAKIEYAPSPHYPLLANIISDFTYSITNKAANR